MTANMMTKNLMSEDLLTKIRREMDERLRKLRSAVDEHERLQAELGTLDATQRPAATGRRGSFGCEPPHTSVVSTKIARLMHAPRRPLQRLDIVHTSAREHYSPQDDLTSGVETTEIDLFPGTDPILEIDGVNVEAMRYERSL
jgi:hypothetical protein